MSDSSSSEAGGGACVVASGSPSTFGSLAVSAGLGALDLVV